MGRFNTYLSWTLVYLTSITNVKGLPIAQRHSSEFDGAVAGSNSEIHQPEGSSSNEPFRTQPTTSEPISPKNLTKGGRILISTPSPENSTITEDGHSSQSMAIDFTDEQKNAKSVASVSLGTRQTLADLGQSGEEKPTIQSATKFEHLVPINIPRELHDIIFDQQDSPRESMDTIIESSALPTATNTNNNNSNKRAVRDEAAKTSTFNRHARLLTSIFWLAFSFTSTFRAQTSQNKYTTAETQANSGQDVTKSLESFIFTEPSTMSITDGPEITQTAKYTDVKTFNCTVEDDDYCFGSSKKTSPNVGLPTREKKRIEIVANGQLISNKTFISFLNDLADLRTKINSTLDMICLTVKSDELPPGVPDCRSHAEILGSKTLPCNASVRTVIINEKNTASEILIASVEAINDHYKLLQTVSELHDKLYPNKIQCTDIIQYSVNHLRCRQDVAMTLLSHLQRFGMDILSDIGVKEAATPSALFCSADLSTEKTFPLGPLWRVQHDLGQIYSNVNGIVGTLS